MTERGLRWFRVKEMGEAVELTWTKIEPGATPVELEEYDLEYRRGDCENREMEI